MTIRVDDRRIRVDDRKKPYVITREAVLPSGTLSVVSTVFMTTCSSVVIDALAYADGALFFSVKTIAVYGSPGTAGGGLEDVACLISEMMRVRAVVQNVADEKAARR